MKMYTIRTRREQGAPYTRYTLVYDGRVIPPETITPITHEDAINMLRLYRTPDITGPTPKELWNSGRVRTPIFDNEDEAA